MGAWDELDVYIEVNLDTSELEKAKNLPEADPYGFFDPYIAEIDNAINAFVEGQITSAKTLATLNRSYQQQFIREVTDNPSGMLMSSIQEQQEGPSAWLIGTILNHIYPMAVEYGRKGFSAREGKALAFYADGELIFRKSVGPAAPRPFVAPAYEKTLDIAVDIVEREVGKIAFK